ncbi:RNA polymerase sigma-70 factor, ECF subfamily [Pseudomonas asplenii]|uniref:RNA polymerase sigma-70 factor, ECF subfamily n=1 Tax=Pseudomonas asplenii TaxID=53407 RepID=A0A1H1TC32_9PSED|nr:RNA polymerase sigma-70 factor, ECF subfamily [Pseudomonas asplenii]
MHTAYSVEAGFIREGACRHTLPHIHDGNPTGSYCTFPGALTQSRIILVILNFLPVISVSSVRSPHNELVGALYRDHRSWLLAWLRRNIACPQRAEDLSQDTFVRLLGRDELKAPREPRAFLAAIAKGLLFDHFRRAALEQAYLNELMLLPENEQPSLEEQQLILEDLKAIDRMLGKLSSKARAAFLYNRLEGLSHADIAQKLGVSVPRVRQYLAQGIRQCYIALYGEPT